MCSLVFACRQFVEFTFRFGFQSKLRDDSAQRQFYLAFRGAFFVQKKKPWRIVGVRRTKKAKVPSDDRWMQRGEQLGNVGARAHGGGDDRQAVRCQAGGGVRRRRYQRGLIQH